LKESDVQQEYTLTSKSSIETTSMAEAAAKIGEPFSSHLIVDSNGISNANTGIESECPTLSAQDAEGDTMEQATDLEDTCLSPNSTVDTHDFANASTDEARNDPCDKVIDSNAKQETISEAFGDSKRGVSSGQDHDGSIEQSIPSLHSDNFAKFHIGTRVTVRCDVSPNYFLHGKLIKVDVYNRIYTVEFDEKDNADPQTIC
jgi:hypothetical protein